MSSQNEQRSDDSPTPSGGGNGPTSGAGAGEGGAKAGTRTLGRGGGRGGAGSPVAAPLARWGDRLTARADRMQRTASLAPIDRGVTDVDGDAGPLRYPLGTTDGTRMRGGGVQEFGNQVSAASAGTESETEVDLYDNDHGSQGDEVTEQESSSCEDCDSQDSSSSATDQRGHPQFQHAEVTCTQTRHTLQTTLLPTMGTEGLFDSFFETIEEMIRGQMGAQAQGQQQQPEAQQTNETCAHHVHHVHVHQSDEPAQHLLHQQPLPQEMNFIYANQAGEQQPVADTHLYTSDQYQQGQQSYSAPEYEVQQQYAVQPQQDPNKALPTHHYYEYPGSSLPYPYVPAPAPPPQDYQQYQQWYGQEYQQAPGPQQPDPSHYQQQGQFSQAAPVGDEYVQALWAYEHGGALPENYQNNSASYSPVQVPSLVQRQNDELRAIRMATQERANSEIYRTQQAPRAQPVVANPGATTAEVQRTGERKGKGWEREQQKMYRWYLDPNYPEFQWDKQGRPGQATKFDPSFLVEALEPAATHQNKPVVHSPQKAASSPRPAPPMTPLRAAPQKPSQPQARPEARTLEDPTESVQRPVPVQLSGQNSKTELPAMDAYINDGGSGSGSYQALSVKKPEELKRAEAEKQQAKWHVRPDRQHLNYDENMRRRIEIAAQNKQPAGRPHVVLPTFVYDSNKPVKDAKASEKRKFLEQHAHYQSMDLDEQVRIKTKHDLKEKQLGLVTQVDELVKKVSASGYPRLTSGGWPDKYHVQLQPIREVPVKYEPYPAIFPPPKNQYSTRPGQVKPVAYQPPMSPYTSGAASAPSMRSPYQQQPETSSAFSQYRPPAQQLAPPQGYPQKWHVQPLVKEYEIPPLVFEQKPIIQVQESYVRETPYPVPPLEFIDKGPLLNRYQLNEAAAESSNQETSTFTSSMASYVEAHKPATGSFSNPTWSKSEEDQSTLKSTADTLKTDKTEEKSTKEKSSWIKRIFGGADVSERASKKASPSATLKKKRIEDVDNVRLKVGMCLDCLESLKNCDKNERLLVAQCRHVSHGEGKNLIKKMKQGVSKPSKNKHKHSEPVIISSPQQESPVADVVTKTNLLCSSCNQHLFQKTVYESETASPVLPPQAVPLAPNVSLVKEDKVIVPAADPWYSNQHTAFQDSCQVIVEKAMDTSGRTIYYPKRPDLTLPKGDKAGYYVLPVKNEISSASHENSQESVDAQHEAEMKNLDQPLVRTEGGNDNTEMDREEAAAAVYDSLYEYFSEPIYREMSGEDKEDQIDAALRVSIAPIEDDSYLPSDYSEATSGASLRVRLTEAVDDIEGMLKSAAMRDQGLESHMGWDSTGEGPDALPYLENTEEEFNAWRNLWKTGTSSRVAQQSPSQTRTVSNEPKPKLQAEVSLSQREKSEITDALSEALDAAVPPIETDEYTPRLDHRKSGGEDRLRGGSDKNEQSEHQQAVTVLVHPITLQVHSEEPRQSELTEVKIALTSRNSRHTFSGRVVDSATSLSETTTSNCRYVPTSVKCPSSQCAHQNLMLLRNENLDVVQLQEPTHLRPFEKISEASRSRTVHSILLDYPVRKGRNGNDHNAVIAQELANILMMKRSCMPAAPRDVPIRFANIPLRKVAGDEGHRRCYEWRTPLSMASEARPGQVLRTSEPSLVSHQSSYDHPGSGYVMNIHNYNQARAAPAYYPAQPGQFLPPTMPRDTSGHTWLEVLRRKEEIRREQADVGRTVHVPAAPPVEDILLNEEGQLAFSNALTKFQSYIAEKQEELHVGNTSTVTAIHRQMEQQIEQDSENNMAMLQEGHFEHTLQHQEHPFTVIGSPQGNFDTFDQYPWLHEDAEQKQWADIVAQPPERSVEEVEQVPESTSSKPRKSRKFFDTLLSKIGFSSKNSQADESPKSERKKQETEVPRPQDVSCSSAHAVRAIQIQDDRILLQNAVGPAPDHMHQYQGSQSSGHSAHYVYSGPESSYADTTPHSQRHYSPSYTSAVPAPYETMVPHQTYPSERDVRPVFNSSYPSMHLPPQWARQEADFYEVSSVPQHVFISSGVDRGCLTPHGSFPSAFGNQLLKPRTLGRMAPFRIKVEHQSLNPAGPFSSNMRVPMSATEYGSETCTCTFTQGQSTRGRSTYSQEESYTCTCSRPSWETIAETFQCSESYSSTGSETGESTTCSVSASESISRVAGGEVKSRKSRRSRRGHRSDGGETQAPEPAPEPDPSVPGPDPDPDPLPEPPPEPNTDQGQTLGSIMQSLLSRESSHESRMFPASAGGSGLDVTSQQPVTQVGVDSLTHDFIAARQPSQRTMHNEAMQQFTRGEDQMAQLSGIEQLQNAANSFIADLTPTTQAATGPPSVTNADLKSEQASSSILSEQGESTAAEGGPKNMAETLTAKPVGPAAPPTTDEREDEETGGDDEESGSQMDGVAELGQPLAGFAKEKKHKRRSSSRKKSRAGSVVEHRSHRASRASGSRSRSLSRKGSSQPMKLAYGPRTSKIDQILEKTRPTGPPFNPCKGSQFSFMDELQSGVSELIPLVPDPKQTDTSGCRENEVVEPYETISGVPHAPIKEEKKEAPFPLNLFMGGSKEEEESAKKPAGSEKKKRKGSKRHGSKKK